MGLARRGREERRRRCRDIGDDEVIFFGLFAYDSEPEGIIVNSQSDQYGDYNRTFGAWWCGH